MSQFDRAALRDAVSKRTQSAIDDLCALVRHESLLGNEASAQDWISDKFATMGLDVERVKIDISALRDQPGFSPPVIDGYDGRENVVGLHRPKTRPVKALS